MASNVAEVYFPFCAYSANNLPKMDTFGKIDAYAKFTNQKGKSAKTKTINKDYSPVWDEKILLPETSLNEEISIEIYDHDSIGDDDLAATATFSVQKLMHEGSLNIELSGKKVKKATIMLTFKRGVQMLKTFSTVANELAQFNVPSHIVDKKHKSVYVPLPGQDDVYLGVEWEKKGEIDFKLLSRTTNVWMDWVQAGKTTIQVDRKNESRTICDIVFVAEAKLDDIKLKDDFSSLSMIVCPAEKVESGHLGQFADKAGWKGMLNYQGARNLLTGVDFDDKQEEIFFPLNDEKSAFFVCDFDKDGIDFKMVITPQANNIAYDMGVKKGKGGDSKKKSRVYNPPKPVCGGKYLAARINEIDDLPGGLNFGDFTWVKYNVGQATVVTIPQVFSLVL